MKTLIKLLPIILALIGVIVFSSCEKKNPDNSGRGKLVISLSLPDETSSSKSGVSTDSSGVVSYHLMISIEDMEGNNVMSDSLIPLYTFGTDFISEKVELNTGGYKLLKFMVINPSGKVIFAAPVGGAPLAYLVNKPLPLTFNIYPGQITRIIPEVLAVGDHTPDQFGYANFGMQIIMPLHFWATCIIDNPLSMAPGLQITTAKLTVYDANRWHYTFNLEAATNHLIIKGGSPVYNFLLEKEGYIPQKMEFTARELMATSNDYPLILKIPWDSTTVNLTKGLVAYYTFDGNANDKSGNNHHGIVHGATLTTDRFGNINNAYIFNGVDTYIDLANTDTLNMLSGFTLATWVNFTASNEGSIVSKHVNYYYNGFTMSAYNCNANLTTDNSHYYIATTETYNDGNWHLFTGVYNGTTLSIYVDGIFKVSGNASYTTGNDINIRIGADSELSFFNGIIDDVRIWKRALNKNEVLSLYPQSSMDKNLVGYYPFNGNASDMSGYGNNGTVHGATLTEDRGGNKNCAYYFDGIDDYIEVPDDPSLRITDEITIEVWTSMEYGGGGDDPRLVSKGGDYDGFELCTDGPQGYGTISVRIAPPSLFIKDILTANKWDHIVAVVDQKYIKLYLNGQLKGSIDRIGPILESSQPLCFGQKSIWGWDKYKGKIDDVRIWKRALSENEILTLFKE